MLNDGVWPAMLEGYERAPGSLTHRLLAALDAAEAQGGDLRGRQSAAIIVVPAAGEPWDTVVSLRVEDHPDPLAELARLLRLHDAYAEAGLATSAWPPATTLRPPRSTCTPARWPPESDELRFWAAVGSATIGDMPTALTHLRRAIEIQPTWLELLGRLSAEAVPSAAGLLEALDRRADPRLVPMAADTPRLWPLGRMQTP